MDESVLLSKKMTESKQHPSKPNWIPVVAGLLRRGDLILVGQRPGNAPLTGGLWEFPGGKIEPDETPEEAIARELSEELGIDATVGDLKLASTHSYGNINIIILFYEILYWKGDIRTNFHLSLDWIPLQKLKTKNILEANRKVLGKIFFALGEPWHE